MSIENLTPKNLINILETEMADSILTENEQKNDKDITKLRYAGHHIIKLSELSINDGSYHDNIVEAYKHCKRAYYDILDGYVLTLSDLFTNKINFIKDENKRKQLNEKLNKLCISTVKQRFNDSSRQKYYSFIAKNLIEGLRVLEKVNHLINETSFLKNKTTLIKNNTILKNRINALESNLSNSERKQDSPIKTQEPDPKNDKTEKITND